MGFDVLTSWAAPVAPPACGFRPEAVVLPVDGKHSGGLRFAGRSKDRGSSVGRYLVTGSAGFVSSHLSVRILVDCREVVDADSIDLCSRHAVKGSDLERVQGTC